MTSLREGAAARRRTLYLALVHYPVLNRKSEVIASAVTNLDLHDLARLTCTYDLPRCYVVTPLEDQSRLARKLVAHWMERIGGQLHPHRRQALQRLAIVPQVKDAVTGIEQETGASPWIWATTARRMEGCINWRQARRVIQEGERPLLLLLGTGWGLAPRLMDEVHGVLEPISGAEGYNHLSVRCAAAIMLDRLTSPERETV